MASGKNIRIKDIARLAGVSAGTVDRVLHNRGRVSDAAQKKITEVMQQIDYKPNLLARTLGSNKKYRLAVIFPDPASDPYWLKAQEGIWQAESEWVQYGISILPFTFDLLSKKSFAKVAETAFEAHPDGVVLAPIFHHESLPAIDKFRTQRIPIVLFNTYLAESHPLSFIGQNLYESGRVGAELMMTGMEGGRIAILHLDEDVMDSVHLHEKEKGFRDVFQETAHAASYEIITVCMERREKGLEGKLETLFRDEALKGVFISTSRGTAVAASVLHRVGKNGIRLIGYDLLDINLPYLNNRTIDFLINQNPKRQIIHGIRHLANQLMFKKNPPPMDLFPLEIITPANVNSYIQSGFH